MPVVAWFQYNHCKQFVELAIAVISQVQLLALGHQTPRASQDGSGDPKGPAQWWAADV